MAPPEFRGYGNLRSLDSFRVRGYGLPGHITSVGTPKGRHCPREVPSCSQASALAPAFLLAPCKRRRRALSPLRKTLSSHASGKKKQHKHKLFGLDFPRTFLTLTPGRPWIKKFLPITGAAEKRTFAPKLLKGDGKRTRNAHFRRFLQIFADFRLAL